MDKIQDIQVKYDEVFHAGEIKEIYQNTHPQSKLRLHGVLGQVRRNAKLEDIEVIVKE
jgi:hypothetical protein